MKLSSALCNFKQVHHLSVQTLLALGKKPFPFFESDHAFVSRFPPISSSFVSQAKPAKIHLELFQVCLQYYCVTDRNVHSPESREKKAPDFLKLHSFLTPVLINSVYKNINWNCRSPIQLDCGGSKIVSNWSLTPKQILKKGPSFPFVLFYKSGNWNKFIGKRRRHFI